MNDTIHPLIIIGSGPAGLTAGVYASRANLKPLILEGKSPGGQLMGTTHIENWPGNISILGPTLMMNMRAHAKHFGSSFLAEEVVKVDFSSQPFTLWTHRNKELKAHAVIIATGAIPNKLGCPGEAEYWGKGVTTCAVCDGAFYPDKEIIIVGGGDTAMEDASFMTKFTQKITIVHIHDKLTASAAMQKRVLENPNIKIIYNSTVTEFKGNGDHVTHAVVTNQKTGEIQTLNADGAFLAIGGRPGTAPFQGQIDLNQWGYINVTNNTNTSVPGVFAAGDAEDYRYKQAITSAGSGCMAALDAERYLEHLLNK
ncbi:MAG: thioredoxin-disulfide reductase [Candidatus Dependentiae bacterium]|nr:thioredoxin-disulfide reductase [Candidatus Dependentiae bacterium]